jgi:hypothetical protein
MPMLHTLLPITLVATFITPVHFTVPVPLISLEFSFVIITTRPSKVTKAFSLVIDIFTFVFIYVCKSLATFPLTFAMPISILNRAIIRLPIVVINLAFTGGLAVLELASVRIAICVEVSAAPVL